MNLADGMKNFEMRYSEGFCGKCNKKTIAMWERYGKRLLAYCVECGTIIIDDEKYFKKEKGK